MFRLVVVDPLCGLGDQWESLYLGGGWYSLAEAHQRQNIEELSGVEVEQSPDEGEHLLFLRGLRVQPDQELKHLEVNT